MKKQMITLGLAAILLGGVGAAALPMAMAAAETNDFDCVYSASTKGADGYSYYGAKQVVTYSAAEAAAAGVPEGYENQVLKIVGSGTSSGILLDYSSLNIPTALVEGLAVRTYLGVSAANSGIYPQLRIPDPTGLGTKWVHQPTDASTPTGEWTTAIIPSTKFANISKDGYLHKFELSMRSNAMIDFFIDSISLELKENDGVAPVISCAAADKITWFAGTPFVLEATAFDEQEKRSVEVQKIFGEGTQFAEDGTLKEGEWSLTLSASDYFGNRSTKTYQVTVLEPDLTAPVITTKPQTIYAAVGSIPMLNPEATDDSNSVTVTASWSQGALDKKGKLTEGTHSYTIVAVDPSGNTTTHTVTVIVSEDGGIGDGFIDEEEKYQERLAAQLKAAQDEAFLKLEEALAAYGQSEYSVENYEKIMAAHEVAKKAIYAETDRTKLEGYIAQFIAAADEVKTLEEETELPTTSVETPATSEPDLPDASDEPNSDEPNSDEPDSSDVPASSPVDESTDNSVNETSSSEGTNTSTKEEGGCSGTLAAAPILLLLGGALIAWKKKKQS